MAARKHCQSKYVKAMIDGSKTMEGRCLSDFWNGSLVGRYIEFYDDDLVCKVEVVGLIEFRTSADGTVTERARRIFTLMLEDDRLRACIPWAQSLEEGVQTYQGINVDQLDKVTEKGMGAFVIRRV
jgi:ASC-1-like (ASCH) protein